MKAPTQSLQGRRRAFALAELLLVLCCLVLAAAAFLGHLVGAARLRHEEARRAGLYAWGQQQRCAVALGIDIQGAAFFSGVDPVACGRSPEPVGRQGFAASGELVPVGLLTSPASTGLSDVIVPALGLELRAAPVAPAWSPPESEGRERVMLAPLITPTPGSYLSTVRFVGGFVRVSLRSPEGGLVCFDDERTGEVRRSPSELQFDLRAGDIARGFSASAWVEFDGAAARGALPVELGDGRMAWFSEEQGTMVRHQPSAVVRMSYGLDAGLPVLRLGVSVHEAGASVPVDYRDVLVGRGPGAHCRLEWNAATQRLVDAGELSGLLLQANFHGRSANGTDLDDLLFASGRLAAWRQMNELALLAQTSGPVRVRSARWHLARTALRLPQPRLAEGEESSPMSPGSRRFVVSELSGVGTPGRLSARGGAILGTSGTLTLEVLP